MAFGPETHRGSLKTHLSICPSISRCCEWYFSIFLSSCLPDIISFGLYFCPCIALCLSVAAQKHAVDAKGLPLQSEPTYLNWEHATQNASNN